MGLECGVGAARAGGWTVVQFLWRMSNKLNGQAWLTCLICGVEKREESEMT